MAKTKHKLKKVVKVKKIKKTASRKSAERAAKSRPAPKKKKQTPKPAKIKRLSKELKAKVPVKKLVKKSTKKSSPLKGKKLVRAKTSKKVVATSSKKLAKPVLPKVVYPKRVRSGSKIGIFGGTFNPIHFGHLNSIENIVAETWLDELWIVPNSQNPLRSIEDGPSPQDRVKMLELGLSTLPQLAQKIKIQSTEIDRGGPSFMIDTLTEFHQQSPDADFWLIVGADQLEMFSQWKNFEQIIREHNLIVTSRPGVTIPLDKSEAPSWLRPHIMSWKGDVAKLHYGTRVRFFQMKDVDVSATEVRKKIRTGEAVHHLTPQIVLEYIYSRGFYKNLQGLVADFSNFAMECTRILDSKGALNIHAYDLSLLVQPTDYAIAASATSTRHAKALADHVVQTVKKDFGIAPISTEGSQEGRWVIIDYGSLMIHIFYDFVRNEYKIEDLWRQGKQLL
jgi:nicotinate-nucleotide adenylyltransferase